MLLSVKEVVAMEGFFHVAAGTGCFLSWWCRGGGGGGGAKRVEKWRGG